MIYKLELQDQIEEICWYPTIDDAADDLIYRNQMAGREVSIEQDQRGTFQFSITYPQINRTVNGTICRYGMGGRLPIDPSEFLEDVQRLTEEGHSRREICSILSISVSTLLNAKKINKNRQHLRQHLKSALKRTATIGNL
ncbi:MAG: hypothetical protein ACO20X_13270 [Alphaproteobacteria bacterium]